VQFFDARGEFSFGVYLGRDAEKRIIPSQLRDFEALWDECGEGGAS
jgi:putative heme iron utilization protein